MCQALFYVLGTELTNRVCHQEASILQQEGDLANKIYIYFIYLFVALISTMKEKINKSHEEGNDLFVEKSYLFRGCPRGPLREPDSGQRSKEGTARHDNNCRNSISCDLPKSL